jgi:hypothetical protein
MLLIISISPSRFKIVGSRIRPILIREEYPPVITKIKNTHASSNTRISSNVRWLGPNQFLLFSLKLIRANE